MNSNKHKYIIITILIISVVITYTLPRAQYVGTGFISNLNIPTEIPGWKGRDITDQLNLDFDKNWNKFISEALIYDYRNMEGQKLVFIILDAGNFHHPNACFTASGYEIKELDTTEFNINGRTIKTQTLFTTKEQENNFSFYWIIVDKKIADNWLKQKIKQLYFSLFNRKRVGLMVRFDIPVKNEQIKDATLIAKQFISELSQAVSSEKADYIFGAK